MGLSGADGGDQDATCGSQAAKRLSPLDNSLFNLWRQGLVEEEEVLHKCHKPNDLKERIENAKKGIFEDEPEEGEGED